jgi:hypothetical protein
MRYLACLLIFIAGAAASAGAQSGGKYAVGASIGTRFAPSPTVTGDHFGVGLLWRIGHSKEGFGWDWGLNWFTSSIEKSFGDTSPFDLGDLHIRPIMVGYGYTHLIGLVTSIKGGVQGGYSFNTFEEAPQAAEIYSSRLGAQSFSTEASNTFVVRPQVSVWRDVSRKVGVNVSAGYMIARPMFTVSTTLGEERQRIRADQFILKMGIVYSVY